MDHVVNALFYTFSTVAQVLAASAAFLGAFRLYLAASVDRALSDLGVRVLQPYLADESAHSLLAENLFPELEAHLSSATPPRALTAREKAHRRAFQSHLQRLRAMRWRFTFALAVTAAATFLSVAVLPFAPAIAADPVKTRFVFAVGLLGLVACLVLQVGFILYALKRTTAASPGTGVDEP